MTKSISLTELSEIIFGPEPKEKVPLLDQDPPIKITENTKDFKEPKPFYEVAETLAKEGLSLKDVLRTSALLYSITTGVRDMNINILKEQNLKTIPDEEYCHETYPAPDKPLNIITANLKEEISSNQQIVETSRYIFKEKIKFHTKRNERFFDGVEITL